MMLCLFISVLVVSQRLSLSASFALNEQSSLKIPSNEKNKKFSLSGEPEAPSFLYAIYEQVMKQAEIDGLEQLLESFKAEQDQETGEFYFPPSVAKKPLKAVSKVEFLISSPELASKGLTASIYEAKTGVKVSARHLSPTGSGWLAVTATKVVNQWIARWQDTAPSFKVFVKGVTGGKQSQAQVSQLWLVVHTTIRDDFQVFPSLAKDNGRNPPSRERIRRDETAAKVAENKTDTRGQSSCDKKDMMVSSSIFVRSRTDWIYPKSFNAYQCLGECSYEKKISHSMLRTLVMLSNNTKGQDFPAPSCVPSKLKPVAIIHRTEKGSYVLRTEKNMIVDDCMCY